MIQVEDSVWPLKCFLIWRKFQEIPARKLWLLRSARDYSRGAPVPTVRSSGRLNFVPWHLIFVLFLWSLFRVALLMARILRWLLHFRKICAPLIRRYILRRTELRTKADSTRRTRRMRLERNTHTRTQFYTSRHRMFYSNRHTPVYTSRHTLFYSNTHQSIYTSRHTLFYSNRHTNLHQ